MKAQLTSPTQKKSNLVGLSSDVPIIKFDFFVALVVGEESHQKKIEVESKRRL